MSNLASLLENSADRHPDRIAIVSGARRLSYAHLDGASNQVANLLKSRGLQAGDKVAVSCPNIPHFSIVYFGVLKAGGIVVPLNIMLKSREVAYHLADSQASIYFAFEGTPELPIGRSAAEGFDQVLSCHTLYPLSEDDDALPWAGQPVTFDAARAEAEDTAVILYTSGTTGQPKGAELRHSNLLLNALACVDIFKMDASRPDTCLSVLPLYHSFGQTCVQNTALACGGTIVMLPRFEAQAALDLMAREKVTYFAGVPTMYWALLAASLDFTGIETIRTTLRVALSGGAAMPAEMHKAVRARFNVPVLEGYGLSETAPVASFAVLGEEPRVGSIGRPIPGVRMKLINPDWTDLPDGSAAVGEIAISGHNVMKGYHNRKEATSCAISNGWFRSGDLARKDADGFFYIVGRSKDMIIRGGFNVYPRELEEVLMTHPAVSLVAVVGVPHESHGEEIKAVIVKQPGDTTTEDELTAWGKAQFAAYKYPRIVQFVETLPMTSTGKILKREIA